MKRDEVDKIIDSIIKRACIFRGKEVYTLLSGSLHEVKSAVFSLFWTFRRVNLRIIKLNRALRFDEKEKVDNA